MQHLMKVLEQVVDPEFGLNVVDMGLVYAIEDAPAEVVVTMTLTTMTCPMSGVIVAQVVAAIGKAAQKPCRVELVWSPAWSPERISQTGLAFLGA